MNQTILLNYIKMKLGIPFQTLEITNDEILNIVKQFTLVEFSTYYPHYERIMVDSVKDEVQPGSFSYFLKTNNQILGVSKFLPFTTSSIVNKGVASGSFENAIGMNLSCNGEGVWGPGANLALEQIYRDNLSFSRLPETYNFIPPNMIEIFPKHTGIYGKFVVECRVVHPEHLFTIPTGLRQYFMDLAFYDVCIALYPIRKRFENLNTAYGDLNLFMQYLEEANDKKRDLLELFNNNYYKSPRKKKIFIY